MPSNEPCVKLYRDHDREIVDERTERIKVLGGWIYQIRTPDDKWQIVFVPSPR